MTRALATRPTTSNKIVKRYEIWMAEMRDGIGSEQVGTRPVVILQNDKGNKYAPTVICAPVTSSMAKTRIPTHVMVKARKGGLDKDSTILLEQIITLDKTRLKYKICDLNDDEKNNFDVALMISVGLYQIA